MWQRNNHAQQSKTLRHMSVRKLKLLLIIATVSTYSAGSLENTARRPVRRRRRGRDEYYIIRTPSLVAGVRG
jgi:hypothetical protein